MNIEFDKDGQIVDIDDQLINAAEDGDLIAVKYLVSKGADIHAENDWASRLAAENEHLTVVKYLVSEGANIHTWNDYALRYAAENGHLPVVKYLEICTLNFSIKKEYHEYR